MQKYYMISITSAASPSNSFITHIFPSEGNASIVRDAYFDDEKVLRIVLNRCLPKDLVIDNIISSAKETGICDLRNRPIPLSDDCAVALGWIF